MLITILFGYNKSLEQITRKYFPQPQIVHEIFMLLDISQEPSHYHEASPLQAHEMKIFSWRNWIPTETGYEPDKREDQILMNVFPLYLRVQEYISEELFRKQHISALQE